MSDTTLGLIITGEANRDAIHIAVAPVSSDETLSPGQRVALVPGDCTKVKSSTSNIIGIVDPFLRNQVPPGSQFYLLLFPKTITSLRHEWTHPQFVQSVPTLGLSDKWMLRYAAEIGLEYDDLIRGARDWILGGEYLNRGPLLEGVELHGDFWMHYEVITGTKVNPDKKESFFSCAC